MADFDYTGKLLNLRLYTELTGFLWSSRGRMDMKELVRGDGETLLNKAARDLKKSMRTRLSVVMNDVAKKLAGETRKQIQQTIREQTFPGASVGLSEVYEKAKANAVPPGDRRTLIFRETFLKKIRVVSSGFKASGDQASVKYRVMFTGMASQPFKTGVVQNRKGKVISQSSLPISNAALAMLFEQGRKKGPEMLPRPFMANAIELAKAKVSEWASARVLKGIYLGSGRLDKGSEGPDAGWDQSDAEE